ncbi:DUF4240 domain-containing protein [Micromonospora sp. NPDC007230]|uniref:DUF4240 domain-containing protein n=1 Tax=Micromonospora sp. NPDC007230 TaxID=3364237 RepID=UPI003682CFBD
METDEFWALVEASADGARTPDERLAWLTDRLAGRPAAEVVDFALRLDELRGPVDTWRLWGAALLIFDGFCSDDSFFYFQTWLIGRGRAAYHRVLADPDALADLPEVRRLAGRPMRDWAEDELPDWECLDYVADEAYERITGEEEGLDDAVEARGRELRCSPEPVDEAWDVRDSNELAHRYPRLAALFPLPGRGRAPVWETATP